MKNKTEKVCPCGRIITDSKNKTGLCPKCEKTAGGGAVAVSLVGLILLTKKYGPKAIKGIGNIIKSKKK